LDLIASLAGFAERLDRLPDGARPDVLRVSVRSGRLFIGEAKETERPSDPGVIRRLQGYMAWFRNNAVSHGAGGVLALCVGCDVDACEWGTLLEELARKAGLSSVRAAVRALDPDMLVVWLQP
jgi:hypothetical protein